MVGKTDFLFSSFVEFHVCVLRIDFLIKCDQRALLHKTINEFMCFKTDEQQISSMNVPHTHLYRLFCIYKKCRLTSHISNAKRSLENRTKYFCQNEWCAKAFSTSPK